MSKLDQWLKDGRYLPERFRDFHAQKELFRAMHELVGDLNDDHFKQVDWITGQCYVIDVFLWFMAKRGYTLQRCRAQVPFRDIDADIAAVEARRTKQFAAMLDGLKP